MSEMWLWIFILNGSLNPYRYRSTRNLKLQTQIAATGIAKDGPVKWSSTFERVFGVFEVLL